MDGNGVDGTVPVSREDKGPLFSPFLSQSPAGEEKSAAQVYFEKHPDADPREVFAD